MTRFQRIKNIFIAMLLILLALLLVVIKEKGYFLVFGILAFTWFFEAIGLILYYFTMARFMVDGKMILLKGVILLDFAVFALYLDDVAPIYIMLYLAVGMIFVNFLEIFRAFDSKKSGSRQWKFRMLAGISGIILAAICLYHYKTPELSGYIYAIELVYSAIVRIYNSFRNVSFVPRTIPKE